MPLCPYCNKRIDFDTEACSACRMTPSLQSQEKTCKSTGSRGGVWLGIVIVLGIIAAAFVFVFTTADQTHNPTESKVAPPPPPPPPPITIAAVGDILLGGRVGTSAERVGTTNPMRKVADQLKAADIAFGNLECPISDRGRPTPFKSAEALQNRREFVFRGVPEGAKALVQGGIDVVSLANNHMMDYWNDALVDTISILDSLGVKHSGAGMDIQSAREPAVVEAKGRRVAFLSYAWRHSPHGVRSFEADESNPGCVFLRAGPDGKISDKCAEALESDIRNAREDSDVVIISVHWGIELSRRPLQAHREAARLAIDLGADAVFGHHPHVLQGIEVYNGKPIAYSLGNFVFPSRRPEARESCILYYTVDDISQRLEILPVLIDPAGVPHVASTDDARRISRTVADLSAELGTRFEMEEDGRLVYHAESP